jgi:nitroreductase
MTHRRSDYPVLPLLLDRWSPRAFDASELQDMELRTLIEAARWAPSAFNNQPWRFVVVRRDRHGWNEAMELLIPFNQTWARQASALIFVLSVQDIEGKVAGERLPSYSHSFDAGAAWAYLALQAASMSLSCHAMTGFDVDRAPVLLGIPPNIRVEAVVAVGRQADRQSLPESLSKREHPSDRMPAHELVLEVDFARNVRAAAASASEADTVEGRTTISGNHCHGEK